MASLTFSHMAVVCKDPIALERWYTKHFGFQRARVVMPGPDQIVFIKRGDLYLELFKATQDSPVPSPSGVGPDYPGWRHLAFQVDDVEAKLNELGDDAKVTVPTTDFGAFISGWKTAWVADPEGNIVEISQGFVDETKPPSLD